MFINKIKNKIKVKLRLYYIILINKIKNKIQLIVWILNVSEIQAESYALGKSNDLTEKNEKLRFKQTRLITLTKI